MVYELRIGVFWLMWNAVEPSKAGSPVALEEDLVVVGIPRHYRHVPSDLDLMRLLDLAAMAVDFGVVMVVGDFEEATVVTGHMVHLEVLDTKVGVTDMADSRHQMLHLALEVVAMLVLVGPTLVVGSTNAMLVAQQAAIVNQ